MWVRITLNLLSLSSLSLSAENITTLKPETATEEFSGWVREGLELWSGRVGEGVCLALMWGWCEWDHGLGGWEEKRGFKRRQEMVGYWGCGSPEVEELLEEGGPRAICGQSLKLARAAVASSSLSFASLSLGTAATAISVSVGVMALILLLVGLLSMTLKKWRHESELKELVLELGMKKGETLGAEMGVSFSWGSLGGWEEWAG